MSHVQLIIPKWSLGMPWVSQIGDVMKEAGHRFTISDSIKETPDVVIFGWCNGETVLEINSKPKTAKYVVFMRRYEVYQNQWRDLDWTKVDEMIFVNDAFKEAVRSVVGEGPKMSVLYNGVDLEKWNLRNPYRSGKNVAMVGFLNHRKNLPMALQIMERLPGYTLHLAGAIQEPDVMAYIENIARVMKLKVVYHGAIPHKFMNKWLDDKDFLLCTSVSEGNPNNVIEAMAKGIKPVVHNWPGADDQFPWELIFNSVDEAVKIIEGEYVSQNYRSIVEQKFSKSNYSKELLGIVEGLCKIVA